MYVYLSCSHFRAGFINHRQRVPFLRIWRFTEDLIDNESKNELDMKIANDQS